MRTSAVLRSMTVVLSAALAALAVWGGCSVEKDYELLSFFFDGVPDPNALSPEAARAALLSAASADGPIVSSHTAYAERRCGECHGETARFGFSVSGFSGLGASVCMKCHAETVDAHQFVHGPVAAGQCLLCHTPHDSIYPSLLNAATPPLCLQCHAFHLTAEPRIPEHDDLERDCLDCHWGHGGRDRAFLRPAPIRRDAEPPMAPPEEDDSTPVEPNVPSEG